MNVKTGLYVGIVAVMVVLTGMVFQGAINADEVGTNGSKVQILVTDTVGVPLSDGVVITSTNDEGEAKNITEQDTDGFYFTTLTPGTYQLTARATGYVSETKELTLAKKDDRQLVFYLEKQE